TTQLRAALGSTWSVPRAWRRRRRSARRAAEYASITRRYSGRCPVAARSCTDNLYTAHLWRSGVSDTTTRLRDASQSTTAALVSDARLSGAAAQLAAARSRTQADGRDGRAGNTYTSRDAGVSDCLGARALG